MTTFDELEARLSRLEVIEAITDRIVGFGHAADYGYEDLFAESFTEDARFEVYYRDAPSPLITYAGRDALRTRAVGHSRAPEAFHKHTYANLRISVTGDTATCDSYFILLGDHEDQPVVMAVGRDRDRLARDESGAWLISYRRVELELKAAEPVWKPNWADRLHTSTPTHP